MSSPEERPQRPIYGPVRLTRLDPQAELQMRRLIHRAARFSGDVLEFRHGYQIAQLGESIGERMVSGEARNGMEIEDLCEGRTAAGHIRDGFGEPMRDFIDLAVRAMFPFSRCNAVHGHIASLPVLVGRDSHAMGVDKRPGVRPMGHILAGSLGSADRILMNQGQWLLTGTRDDHSSPQADPERIVRISKELGSRPPGPVDEHLQRQFAAEDRTKLAVVAAAEAGHPAFEQYWIEPEKFTAFCFPRCLIVDLIPYGPPDKRGAASGAELYPGDSEAVIETLLTANRYGVVRRELPEPEMPLRDVRDHLIPALEEQLSETPKPLPNELFGRVVNWTRAHELQVGESLHRVRYWWFERAGCLLRSLQITGVDDGEILQLALWGMAGIERRHLHAAVVLTERAEQSLARNCHERYRHESEIGLMKSWKSPYRESLLVASLLPNAAGVTAHREMEVREEGSA